MTPKSDTDLCDSSSITLLKLVKFYNDDYPVNYHLGHKTMQLNMNILDAFYIKER